MAEIPARAVLHIDRREWHRAEVRAAARRAQTEEARVRSDIEVAKHAQRVDMQARLHLVVAPGDWDSMYVASRWDLEAFLDPRRVERFGRLEL